jgi:hypothetical protein
MWGRRLEKLVPVGWALGKSAAFGLTQQKNYLLIPCLSSELA